MRCKQSHTQQRGRLRYFFFATHLYPRSLSSVACAHDFSISLQIKNNSGLKVELPRDNKIAIFGLYNLSLSLGNFTAP